MSSWWKILDVNRDADLRTIKSAYAKKLKTIRQDEDPAAFMELREAYEQARNSANFSQNPESPPLYNTPFPQDQIEDYTNPSHQSGGLESGNPESENLDADINNAQLVELLEQTQSLLKDSRNDESINIQSWGKLFTQLENLDVNQHMNFENEFFVILMMHCQNIYNKGTKFFLKRPVYIPRIMGWKTAHFIFEYFGWNRETSHLYYEPSFIFVRDLLEVQTSTADKWTEKKYENAQSLQTSSDDTEKFLTGGFVLFCFFYLGVIGNLMTAIFNSDALSDTENPFYMGIFFAWAFVHMTLHLAIKLYKWRKPPHTIKRRILQAWEIIIKRTLWAATILIFFVTSALGEYYSTPSAPATAEQQARANELLLFEMHNGVPVTPESLYSALDTLTFSPEQKKCAAKVAIDFSIKYNNRTTKIKNPKDSDPFRQPSDPVLDLDANFSEPLFEQNEANFDLLNIIQPTLNPKRTYSIQVMLKCMNRVKTGE